MNCLKTEVNQHIERLVDRHVWQKNYVQRLLYGGVDGKVWEYMHTKCHRNKWYIMTEAVDLQSFVAIELLDA